MKALIIVLIVLAVIAGAFLIGRKTWSRKSSSKKVKGGASPKKTEKSFNETHAPDGRE